MFVDPEGAPLFAGLHSGSDFCLRRITRFLQQTQVTPPVLATPEKKQARQLLQIKATAHLKP